MTLTSCQAKVIAWELTRRKGDTLSRIAETLADIPVDLNPHQIDAAVFAIRSPFIKGVILADEVGLGKSVETGIVLAQLFAEGHKRFLIVCSGHLLDQWSTQLQEHFLLPCRILHERSFDDSLPEAFDGTTLVSYTVCSKYAEKLAQVPWNRVVFDDAFLLKNLYRNDRKTGSTLLSAFDAFCKIIITATPIQNSPMELWSLLRFIDET
ncbi:MAG: SNF2-related protein, partial [Planctomycetia bacterium]|nr:SNF2-related protein [Planctomycetia bacterium]